ncbi:nuclear transport factor 2 family protein [Croceitalea rosinachiae]|uniref:Nuclear transport factor 2 family protein n=1 Tax=Croceitalea rosinachiae TaxID=3075596 RepID=A0ABU3AAR6_9FLAO|nr:nuclear transport factor 2 family protein [Croceitalea sp. F388]MDT0607064.1 nuclear transport factor 2 family protein [Croceitalea sp. F388]
MYKENSKEIEKVITNYFEGIFYGDANKLESCFTDNAIIYGDINGVPYKKSRDEYIDGVKNRQSPNDLNEAFKMETIGIDILGNIAMAKVHLPMLGYNYYDYLSLTKIDNHWKIVNKIFSNVS